LDCDFAFSYFDFKFIIWTTVTKTRKENKMADLISNGKTNLSGEEVIVRAVQFFTTEKWRCQSQSPRVATFVGRPPIPIGLILLTIIGFAFFIIPGIIMYIVVIRKVMRFQNIVVTANPMPSGSEVVITHPPKVQKLASQFLNALPQGSTATAA
jgi:hypothetical protein